MKSKIEQAVRTIDSGLSITGIEPVSGGSISTAYRARTSEGDFFVKWHEEAPQDFFRQEAAGLDFIRGTAGLYVPKVYTWSKKYIVMEFVSGEKSRQAEERLGSGIAELHSQTGSFYGLEEDNFIGELPQVNGWEEDWLLFFREKRLKPQLDLARSMGRLTLQRERNAYDIMSRLSEWVPSKGAPVKVHGDLWGGNWIGGPGGLPCVMDPAVFYGDREFDIAFTYLFGGFSEAFYSSYESVYPLSKEFEDRRPLYQLYYLLVHLNIFGETYGASVDQVLQRYARVNK
ncbi:fructosamine-3-kinase [Sinobaca qinghaiensis]|uniref:Fructosamine-3-kinase n=1 Tax=Sinobaca qinghaiensis TaxID=342944 RepID=A0A419V3A0_9BACL|nr:fructosamine kinase family protein [Sinobaca qinghaiensis]RKD72932.1 fructosamine-3-kinase [Sinobaca qinghaiensis]